MKYIYKNNPIYAIKNSMDNFLNIRITDTEGNPIYNSYKEKRFWISPTYEQALAQLLLLNIQTGLDHTIVEIREVEK